MQGLGAPLAKRRKKMRKLSVVITVVALINFGLVAYAAAFDKAETENQQEAIVVKNMAGEYVGTVTNLLVDSSGDVGFIVLSIGEDKDQGKTEVAVPLGIFSYDTEHKSLIVNISKKELAAAPRFDVSDLTDPAFAEKVYRFFGLMPAWTEEKDEL